MQLTGWGCGGTRKINRLFELLLPAADAQAFGRQQNNMSSILDIDFDYFNLVDNPVQRLEQLLAWADCPISFIAENHHEVLRWWRSCLKKGHLREPQ
jgi:hypothetical protein